jgi:hypothetical protein
MSKCNSLLTVTANWLSPHHRERRPYLARHRWDRSSMRQVIANTYTPYTPRPLRTNSGTQSNDTVNAVAALIR